MSDRFHRAARDGLLEVLKEATKRDCNFHDEDGMTPTIYAAYEGRLDALRLLVGRGGDPDKCDHFGNTALHCAAARGHMPCVSFLVNFGVNLWALDNDFHTPKELAALNNKEDILRYLDNIAAEQETANAKEVRSRKEKALKEAERRIKDFTKIQKKATKRAEKEEKRLQKERERMLEATSTEKLAGGGISSKIISTISKNSISGLSVGSSKTATKESLKFSEMVSSGPQGGSKRHGAGVKGKIQQKKESSGEFKVREVERDGNRTVRSLSGLRRDNEVLYVPKYDADGVGDGQDSGAKRGKIPMEFDNDPQAEGDVILHEPASLFDRPGFGSVAFRNSISATLSNLRRGETLDEEEFLGFGTGRGSVIKSSVGCIGDETSIGSAGSIVRSQEQEAPWEMEDLTSDEEMETTPLQTLLAATGLLDWLPVLNKERIDLEALMLLEESDLNELGVPLGPRKKLLKALKDRKDAIENPGDVIDSKV